MTDKHTCCGEIWHGFGFNRCGRGAKYAHEGNWYCKTHHPPTVKQKNEAWRTALEEKRDAERKAREEAAAAKVETERRAALYPELLEALKLAQSIIGHPEDAHSKLIAAAIAKAQGEQK
jgi:hypothetical protein